MELNLEGVPVLETPRLILREFQAGDFDDFADMWADPVVVKHISGIVATRGESWVRLMSHAGSWPLLGLGYWVVVEKESEKFVGIVGFGEMHREMEPSIKGQPEAGWVLAQWAHGQGFATEAMQRAMEWGLARFDRIKPVCIVDPEYGATKRVAEKCGFADKILTTYKGDPCLIMEYHG